MKKTFISFRSITEVLKYIREKKPSKFMYDPQGLRLTLTDTAEKRRKKKDRYDARAGYLESLANLKIDLD